MDETGESPRPTAAFCDAPSLRKPTIAPIRPNETPESDGSEKPVQVGVGLLLADDRTEGAEWHSGGRGFESR